jgi:MFS family permease
MATFMEVLDSSIANVALPHIAGTLGASTEESTWVLTSYLVSSAIALPMSEWLSNVIGRKRFYMLCVAVFTVSSFLCNLATSLPMLIIFRILQGAGGGGLQPSEQAILADTFSVKMRGMAFAMYGMAVVVAPAIGPTLGGWDTDNYSWHWIFFINVPIGVLSLSLTHRVVQDPVYLKELRRSKVNVDYAIAVTFSFILGIVLNGSTILLPQFLQNDLGYTAERAGMALSPGGIALAFMMTVAGILTSRFDPRVIIAIGFAVTSFRTLPCHPSLSRCQLQHNDGLQNHSGHRYPVDLHSHQHIELCRRSPREVQSGLRHQQFHAQHRWGNWRFLAEQLHHPTGPDSSQCSHHTHESCESIF